MKLPDIWGQGALFVFSGLDGECITERCMDCTLLGDNPGVRIHGKEQFDLYITTDDITDIKYCIIASDIISALLTDSAGKKYETVFTFLNQSTIIGKCRRDSIVLRPLKNTDGEKQNNTTVYNAGEKNIYFWQKNEGDYTYFSVSYDAPVPVCDEIINTEKCRRIGFFEKFSNIPISNENVQKTFCKSLSVMKSQIHTAEGMFKHKWTTPDRLPHKWLWLWDSVFHSFGNYILGEGIAEDTIMSVLDTQRADGFIPHMATPSHTSEITQPPVLAWGVLTVYERTNDTEFLRNTADKLELYLDWNIKNRTNPKSGLFMWHVDTKNDMCRCDESGMDNSPRFDGVSHMECIDFCCFMLNEARSMSEIYSILGIDGRKHFWAKFADDIKEKINQRLWDSNDRFYYDRILQNGKFRKVRSVASFLPLFCGACTEDTAQILVNHLNDESTFRTKFGIPSVAKDDKTYGTDMWRGPVWINYNYMIAKGLKKYGFYEMADGYIKNTVNEIVKWYLSDGVFYEMYDPTSENSPRRTMRKGPAIEPYNMNIRYQSIRDYGWTVTLFASMILENPDINF